MPLAHNGSGVFGATLGLSDHLKFFQGHFLQ